MATSTNYTSMAYVVEETEGEAPATPQFQVLPTTGGSPVANISTATSDVIREDRQTDDLTVVDADISGDINYELSYAPYVPFIKSVLQSETPVEAINVTGVTAVGATSDISKTGIESLIDVGDYFTITSVAEPDIDGNYKATVVVANTVTVTPALPGGAAATDLVVFASISIVDATAVGATDAITNTGIHTEVSIGDVFRVTSVTEPAKVDGLYTCIDNTTTDSITIYPSFPASDAAAVDLSISASYILSNGAAAPDSYTFRKKATESATPYYWYYHGCRINTMSFNFSTGSILNGTFGVIGRTEDARTTVLTGEQTDLPIPTYSIMNSVNSVGTVYLSDGEGGQLTLGTCSFSSLDLTIDNQTQPAKSIGTLGACDTASYSVQITGNIEIYFKNLEVYTKFKDADDFGITIILDDDAGVDIGNSIGINMKYCKFETLDTPIDGKDSFLMQSGSFKALRDPINDDMIKFSLIDKV